QYRFVSLTTWQYNGELLTTDSAEHIVIAHKIAARFYNRPQCPIADCMAVGIVNIFKVIQIKQDKRHRLGIIFAIIQRDFSLIIKMITVTDTGKLVILCNFLKATPSSHPTIG